MGILDFVGRLSKKKEKEHSKEQKEAKLKQKEQKEKKDEQEKLSAPGWPIIGHIYELDSASRSLIDLDFWYKVPGSKELYALYKKQLPKYFMLVNIKKVDMYDGSVCVYYAFEFLADEMTIVTTPMDPDKFFLCFKEAGQDSKPSPEEQQVS